MLLSYLLAAGFALAGAEPIQRGRSSVRRGTTKTLVSAAVYADLEYYAQFPMSGQDLCTDPPSGIVEQQWFDINSTSTQAAIFRIDSRQEFVLAIPGTNDWEDYVTDAEFWLTTYDVPNVTCENCEVFNGIQNAWISLAVPVEEGLRNALAQYPDYIVTISGHSLGGGISELAFGSLKPLSLNINAIYTFGAPRVGNQQFANYIDGLSGASDTDAGIYFRVTHYNDPFPSLPPSFLGYVHPRSEYWESTENASLATTYQCYGQEPSDCSSSITPALSFEAHVTYAGMKDFC